MEKEKLQDFKHHVRLVPLFHYFVIPVLLINVIYRLVELKNGISFGSVFEVFVAAALFLLPPLVRLMALGVQDRVIRLEMQLRIEKLLPADLRARAGEFTLEQLIALRFASDEELPSLCRQVLDEKIADRKTIKRRIKNWRPDYVRA